MRILLSLLIFSSLLFISCYTEDIEIDAKYDEKFYSMICPKESNEFSVNSQCPARPKDKIRLVSALGLYHLKGGFPKKFVPTFLVYSKHAGIADVPVEILSTDWHIPIKNLFPHKNGSFAFFLKPMFNKNVEPKLHDTSIQIAMRQKEHWCYCAKAEGLFPPPLDPLLIPKICDSKKIVFKFLLHSKHPPMLERRLKAITQLVFVSKRVSIPYELSVFQNAQNRWQLDISISCVEHENFHLFLMIGLSSALHLQISSK